MGALDEAIKTRMVDEDGRPQNVTEGEAALGFALTVIPNYGKGHYGLTPAQASAVAVSLPDGGHIVKERGLRPGDIYYAHWSGGTARRPKWTGDTLAEVKVRFGLPVPAHPAS